MANQRCSRRTATLAVRREQRRLCIATAVQLQPPSIISTARAAQALWRKKCIATARAATNLSNARDRGCIDARAGQTTHRLDEATAATEQMHRAGESSAYISTLEQGQQPCMHRGATDGESSADHASLRRSNGSDRACIATARAAQTEQCAAEQRQRQSVHRDGESSADYASLLRCNGSQRRREQHRLCIAMAELRQ